MAVATKAVNVWTWRRMLRDHGPANPSVLLTLYTIATYMDGDGATFVGQQRIAEGARAVVRTVQRHIGLARDLGWIHVDLVRVSSKTNTKRTFMNNYRACIPAHLELTEKDDGLRDGMLARVGDVERKLTWRPSDEEEGHDTIVSSPSEGGDIQSPRTRHPAPKVTTFSVEGHDTALSQELFSLNSSVLTHQSEGALARTARVDKSTRKAKTTEPVDVEAERRRQLEGLHEKAKRMGAA